MQPIHVLALQGDIEAATMILEKGADVNAAGDVRQMAAARNERA
jgi:hypothetical protein